MVRGLLARDPAKRLGSKGGAAEVRRCEVTPAAAALCVCACVRACVRTGLSL